MTVVQDQGDVVAFLQKELSRPGRPVETTTTHASHIFLTADRAYKLKRAVRFPFLDFSTAEKRIRLCHTEVALNRRTARDLYLGVRTITREADGSLAWDGGGAAIDAVVEMRRFDADDLFDRIVQRGALTPAVATRLTQVIADLHKAAPVSTSAGGAAAMAHILEMNGEALRGSVFPEAAVADVVARFRGALERHSARLDERRANGKVRRCHGDLTLRNICLFNGEPTLFDCLEFNEDLATIDVLYDLAFLLMDLWHRDRHDLASLVFNRYFDLCEDTDGLPLLPFFMAVRACIRAHVTATLACETKSSHAASLRDEAHRYFDLADRLLPVRPARLVAVGGLSGSGKSTVAAAIAPFVGNAPGARVLSSDRIRKTLLGVPAEARLPEEAYRPEMSRKVYQRIRDLALTTLAVRHAVVADAVFDRPEERTAIEAVADRQNVPFAGFWLDAPVDILVARVTRRVNDPSDATAGTVHQQAARDAGSIAWFRLDARKDPGAIRGEIVAAVDALPIGKP